MFIRRSARRSVGFTLVELLVVIAIIGVLVALLLPAVQAARESARRSQCQNHLKQLSLGWLLHESTHEHLPTGGWAYTWLGDPDRGFGKDQPGGWRFNVLPYIEQGNLHDLAAGTQRSARQEAMKTLVSTPVALFYCPSRRTNTVYVDEFSYKNYGTSLKLASKADYVASWGSLARMTTLSAAGSYDAAETFNWPDVDLYSNGVQFQRSTVKFSDITDGTSNTFILGEKNVNPDFYEVQGLDGDIGDNQNPYNGFDADTTRSTYIDDWPPIQDRPGINAITRFGSAHPGTLYFALADGSVRGIGYEIDQLIYAAYGSRNGGEIGFEE